MAHRGCIVAPLLAVSRLCPAVSWPCRGAWAPVTRCVARRVIAQSIVSHASCVVSWRISTPYSSPGVLYRDPKSPPSATIQFFVSRPTLWQGRSCARCSPLRTGQPCRARGWPYRGPLLVVSQECSAVSWLCPSWPCTPLRACVLLCHDTVCCIVTKPGKWAVAHSSSCNFFFFHIIFFHCSSCCKTTKKNIFFSMCYSPSTQITQHTHQFMLYTQFIKMHNGCMI